MNINIKEKVYIKTNNNTSKIMSRYTISLVVFIMLTTIVNLILQKQEQVLLLIKSLFISFIISSILSYLINIFKKKYQFIKIYTEDHTEIIAIIIGLFGINTNILIILFSIFTSLIIKNISKNINISSSLYGILIIFLYKYINNDLITPLTTIKQLSYNIDLNEVLELGGGLLNYLFGIEYLSPLISIIAFIYLFHKKSIKYTVLFSYITTVFAMTLIFGIINNFIIWIPIFELLTGSIIFLSIYILTDYKTTPLTTEGNILYGMILGILSTILRFIIPELSIIISLIIGPLLLTKSIDKISPNLKYNQKLYYKTITINTIISIITIIILSIIF